MATFLDDQFLLHNPTAERLYHEFAEDQPIYDYHCHLPPEQIATNHRFRDLSEIWLEGDHYKWRAMRANGVDERLCTGNATPYEKHVAWMETLPYTLRNPLHHWSHLELKRYFGIEGILHPGRAEEVWNVANEGLSILTTHAILRRNRVAVVCTTDDPADSLDWHEQIKNSDLETRVYPAYRPDKAFSVDHPDTFVPWVERLSETVDRSIHTFDDLLGALHQRHDDFHAAGCRLSDHGLESAPVDPCSLDAARSIFDGALSGAEVSGAAKGAFGAFLMLEFARWDAAKGWTKQLHLGALRNANTRGIREIGPDTGFDSIGDLSQGRSLARYLDALDAQGSLPQMVLYNNNPNDNYLLAAMAGSFQSAGKPGKIQFGSGWWFLDQREGIEWQLNALSNVGLLRRFVGMLTDSRSFLSYTRHEYFRRVLCNLLGGEVERGDLPNDIGLVGQMVSEICFANARGYFGLELAPHYR